MFCLKKKFVWLGCILFSVLLIAANKQDETPEQRVKLFFTGKLVQLANQLQDFKKQSPNASEAQIKEQFKNCRLVYKEIEFLVEYYYPGAANRINGAPLLEAEPSEPEEPQHPTGFQVLEELVYEEITSDSRLLIVNEISSLDHQVRKVQSYLDDLQPDAVSVFDALRLNTYRMIAKGLSGFDSPAALNNIPEAVATLQSMREVLGYYEASSSLVQQLDAAISFAAENPDFNSFDRAVFIAGYINPLLQELHNFQLARKIAFISSPRAVQPNAAHLFDKDAYNLYYFAPSGTAPITPALTELGKKLFNDPRLSSTGKRSCSSCHAQEKAFTDGLAVNTSLFANRQLSRNTPTLINAGLQPVQFADSRISFLEDQVHAVVSNRDEMAGDFNSIVAAIAKDKHYKILFSSAFNEGKQSISQQNIKKALAAYVRSLTSLNSRFDQYMRGNNQAMNSEEIRGFNLFMSKAKCGTCHYVPLFSGAVPPLYDKMESEVLGVPATTDTLHPVVDADSGKFHLYKMPHQLFSFKTPGLRNIAFTAPYMHNGVYKTLEEVVDFYNKGGGNGLGFEIESMTLAPDKLELTTTEKKALIAFMHTLTDTAFVRPAAIN
ncbi:MAG: hypothetical protein K0R82_2556 [Flavipsychrobacter sp.]|jgi:cytochrome c peroxidase|nr:hypothetical protein [Flavipsychrobacter sp.]